MIRPVQTEDLAGLVELERRCFGEHAWGPKQLEGELSRPGGICLVSAAECFRGMALGWSIAGDAELLRLAVDPGSRRLGLGRKLLTALQARMVELGAEQVFLEVRSDNRSAIALYLAQGYARIGARPRYYADGCDALVLSRQL